MRPFVIARIWVGPTLPMLSGGMAKAVSESWMPRKLVPMAWGLNRRPGAAPASGGHWDTAAAGTRCRGGSSFRRSTSGLTSRPRDRSSGARRSRAMIWSTVSVTPGLPVQGEPADSWLQALGTGVAESAPRHQRKTAGDRAFRPVKIGPTSTVAANSPHRRRQL